MTKKKSAQRTAPPKKRICKCTQGYCCDFCWARAAKNNPCPWEACANPAGHTGNHGPFDNTGVIQITAADILGALHG